MKPHERMSVEHMLIAGFTLDTIERHIRKWAIIKVLNAERGHHLKAAERLGIHRNTLTRMIKDLGIAVRVNGWQNPRRLCRYPETIPRQNEIVNERDPQMK